MLNRAVLIFILILTAASALADDGHDHSGRFGMRSQLPPDSDARGSAAIPRFPAPAASATDHSGPDHPEDCRDPIHVSGTEVLFPVFNSQCFNQGRFSATTQPGRNRNDDLSLCSCLLDQDHQDATSSLVRNVNDQANRASQIDPAIRVQAQRDSLAAHASLVLSPKDPGAQGLIGQLSQVGSRLRVSDLDLKFFSDNPPAGSPNCISLREYLTFQQIPKDNSFYSFLQDPQSNNVGEWNYNQLKSRLISLTRGQNFTEQDVLNPSSTIPARAEILRITAQMRFLNANPLFKQVFSLNGSDDGGHVGIHQRKLLDKMRSRLQARSRSCSNDPNPTACQSNFIRNTSFTEFAQDAQGAIGDNHMYTAIRGLNEQQMLKMLGSESPSMHFPEEVLRDADLAGTMCTNPQTDVEGCTKAWGAYCNGLRRYAYHSGEVTAFVSALETETAGLFKSPGTGSENQGYREFVEFACNTRRGKDNHNYLSYYNQVCSGRSRPSKCNNRLAMVREYLDKYDSSAENGGSSEAAQRTAVLAKFLEKNTVEAFPVTVAQDIRANARVVKSSSSIVSSGFPDHDGYVASGGFTRSRTSSQTFSPADERVARTESARSETSRTEVAPQSTGAAIPPGFGAGFDSGAAAALTPPPAAAASAAAPLPQGSPDLQRRIESLSREEERLASREKEMESELERARQQGKNSAEMETIRERLSSVQRELQRTQEELTRVRSQSQTQTQVAERESDDFEERNSVRPARGPASVSQAGGAGSATQGRSAGFADNGVSQATNGAGVGNTSQRPLSGTGPGPSQDRMNQVVYEANMAKSGGPTLRVSNDRPASDSAPLPVQVPENILAQATRNPESIRTYADREIERRNLQGERVVLQVSREGSVETESACQEENSSSCKTIIGIWQGDRYNYFTPAQVAIIDRKDRSRSPASTQRNAELSDLQRIIGPR